MSDDPTARWPNADPDRRTPGGTDSPGIEPEPVTSDAVEPDVVPGRAAHAARGVALVVIAFVAMLLLLLGATRLIDRDSGSAGPSSSVGGVAVPSATAGPASSPTPVPSGSGGSAVPSGSPSAVPTPSQASGDPVLVGAGDIGDCGETGDEETAKLLDGIEGTVVTLGDNAYSDGTADEFARCYGPNWGRHVARTRPAPGNHDWGAGNLDGYRGFFGANAAGPDGASWYSYDLGTWHIVVLDSNCKDVGGCDEGSPQMEWLSADLAASDATCTLAYWHHPRFSSGVHGNQKFVGPFWEALYAADADVVLNGHDHDYERFAPQDPDGNEDLDRGITEFVVGTGGTNLRRFEKPKPNSEVRARSVHGVIALTLHDGSYDWEFIPTPGNDFTERGTANCH